uniref:Sodium/potassium-transporting ATPase subunit beta n=1 Tax=Erpetoichthys calabaricus TaxID=27687 RepID=A0A8C4SUS6_ERPCA
MSSKEDKPVEQSQSSWKDFIYNPRSGEFIGRTARSWALILLFYLIFYGFLAGLFSLTMWVMLQTLDDYTPKYRDRISNPGLVIRPKAPEIIFNRSAPSEYKEYTDHLEAFLSKYNGEHQQNNIDCTPGAYFIQDNQPLPKQVCKFERSLLGQCSGITDQTFGYSEGRPCIIVKMNRIIGLKPKPTPFINCTAKKDDKLSVNYFPENATFDSMYFPYYGKLAHEGYVQPLVAVKLLLNSSDFNKKLSVECKIEGSNLLNNDDRDKFLGRVAFQVKVTE